MTVFDTAHADLDDLIAKTVVELAQHRAAGGTDDTFQERIVAAFQHFIHIDPTLARTHMALCVYRLALQQNLLNELDELDQL